MITYMENYFMHRITATDKCINMPKIYCFCGKTDILTFYSEKFFEKMKKAKKPFELHVFDGMYHVFPLYPLKAAREVFGNVCRFIKE